MFCKCSLKSKQILLVASHNIILIKYTQVYSICSWTASLKSAEQDRSVLRFPMLSSRSVFGQQGFRENSSLKIESLERNSHDTPQENTEILLSGYDFPNTLLKVNTEDETGPHSIRNSLTYLLWFIGSFTSSDMRRKAWRNKVRFSLSWHTLLV